MVTTHSSPHPKPTIAVVGFGKVGTVIARLSREAGHRVVAAASGDPADIALIAHVLTPGVEVGWVSEAIDAADIVVLALPLHAVRDLPLNKLAGKIVVDATNHWLEVDGPRAEWVADDETSSHYVQGLAPRARIVKAFNHLGYHDLAERSRPARAPDRIAMGIAGDDPAALQRIAALVDAVGFDPLPLGALVRGRPLEPGHAAFGAVLPLPELEILVHSNALSTAG